ncbi:MAG: hypothetical protein HQ583_02925, partial [Candidatus Abyssubacteria bacterium]|nr:hypothetical protein [Candidatus Abyssubacteria bacterium]
MGNKLDTPYRYIHFVNHSHVDHTWWNSPQACRERNEQIIDSMLSACESNAEFKFSYETTSGLMNYLEKYPGRKKDIRSLLESGRLAIGGLFVSANADAVSEEAVARNFYFGVRWLEKTLGYSPRIANEYDTPGHTLQTPQLVRSAGMDALVITRGPRGSFYWTGPDGSEIFTLCVPYNWSYWRKLGVDFEQTEMNLPPELKRAEESYPGPHLVIPDGDDMTLPNISLPEIVERWNENYDRPKLLLSTMREAIDKIRAKKLPRRSGDMPNLWAVVHALQAETTREMKETQNLLAVAEALYAMRCTEKGNFKVYPAAEIDSCWKRALLATDHNWGGHEESGHAAEGDEYKGNLAKDALRDCHKLIEGAVEGLAHALPKEGVPEEMPVLAFNPVGWSRTDVISVEVSCSIPGLEAIEIVDDKKQPVPYSTTVLEKHDDDTILRARADFLGRDLPPLGYSTYFAKPIMDRKEPQAEAPREGAAIENEFYRVEFSEDG